jgi:hypothetical protein
VGPPAACALAALGSCVVTWWKDSGRRLVRAISDTRNAESLGKRRRPSSLKLTWYSPNLSLERSSVRLQRKNDGRT